MRRKPLRACPLSEARALARAFVCFGFLEKSRSMTYFAYLDEFGHIGPYVSREDPKHNDSPVFGLAGFILPSGRIREFGTWFFQCKCQLLSVEIKKSGKHPAQWEKKGSMLYTVRNVHSYPELRHFTNRLLKKIKDLGGFIFYFGIKKTLSPDASNPRGLYNFILKEAVKRIDQFCESDCNLPEDFILILDEHGQRPELITKVAQDMYGGDEPRRRLIEPLFQAESHRYQTLQAADWIAGLVGRLGACWAEPTAYSHNQVFRQYFEQRLREVQRRSGVWSTCPKITLQDHLRIPLSNLKPV